MKAMLLALALGAPLAAPADPQAAPTPVAVDPPGEPAGVAAGEPVPPACGKASEEQPRLSPRQRKAVRTAVTVYRIANPSLVRVGFTRKAVKLRLIGGRKLVSIPLPRRGPVAEPSRTTEEACA